MSVWTEVIGTIKIRAIGRTKFEKEYILNTVLDHQPLVSGSEGDMQVDILPVKNQGRDFCDEFLEYTDKFPRPTQISDYYIVSVYGNLRDKTFKETIKEVTKWLCRLSKRQIVENVNIKIESGIDIYYFNQGSGWRNTPYLDMCEDCKWTDYLRWEYNRDENGNLLDGKPE